MKNLNFLGCVINVILYILYILVVMFFMGVIYGALSGGQTDTSIMDKIWILSIIFTLIVTVIFRKFFYKQIWSEAKVIVSDAKIVKTQKMKVGENTTKKEKGKMKIYVDKEIK